MAKDIPEIVDTAAVLLTRTIAQGGMSIVYEGRKLGCEGFEKRVAVKMLRQQWSENERFMKLFIAEAKLVSDLVHENIVQIYQLGKTSTGAYYIIMEYVEGLSLHEFIAHHAALKTRIPEKLVVHIASRIARGLAYAHSFRDRCGRRLNIVHRDVCPRNILITTEGLSKLTDFGIAQAIHHTVIGDNWLTGKVAYMSPEQAARRPLDSRTDIYSLGAVLFEMLACLPIRLPDMDPARPDFAGAPIPWDVLPPGTGQELVDLLRRMLDRDPDRRFANANDLARALEYYIYKDGYGPTIQTVEEYLRRHFPALYRQGAPAAPKTAAEQETVVDPDAETLADS